MKKFIPVLSIFIILSFVFVSLTYVQQGDKPSEVAIDNALYWAGSLEGQQTFPYSDGTGDYDSWLNCTNFVSNAYGVPALYNISAGVFWIYSDDQHPGDWNAPIGSLVFFSPTEKNLGKGHVALSTGNGNLIEAGYPTIMTSNMSAENVDGDYLGWAWPPLDWPGRTDGFIPTAFIWITQIEKATILALAFQAMFLIIKNKMAKSPNHIKHGLNQEMQ